MCYRTRASDNREGRLTLSMRVFECDNCGLVIDRDANAGRNLVALAARTTGTGVAGDLDPAKAESKPRGADRKTRSTRPRHKAGTGRAGAAIPSPRAGKETGDRQQATRTQLTPW
ncbi:zinc ribbon domain-containing protein [Streptomyces sp. NPDC058092]|uniref:zinc ribbon domain-containing protein n=1 Tax=Streptomyces sp. NPDC058092 TaxID=3346336 RepID=UPI0036F0FFDC